LPRIGLVVLDEEHDPAYKQDRPPRYHARAVAERLAELHGALLILGSATPDVETVYRANGAGWKHVQLTERVGQRVLQPDGSYEGLPIELPPVTVVDMRAELRGHGQALLSNRLLEEVGTRLRAGEQTLLFLNRRGSSTFVQCRTCGEVAQCPHCEIPLVYHRSGDRLMCHRCGARFPPLHSCPACGSAAIGYYGAGTQRVESEISEAFPAARVLRWDRDAVRRGGQERMLGLVQSAEVDIVVGTQMIAKGLDLPSITLVGIINADGMLYLPDFRAAERTFQLLAQVSGRAGRRTSGGEVILQTFTPEHYAIRFAARHDFTGFYAEELAFRRRLGYPPFKRLARLTYRHTDYAKAAAEADQIAAMFERWVIEHPHYSGIDIIGPAPAFAGKVRDRYVWQLLLRGDLVSQLLGDINPPPGWSIDVDPVNLL
jgi:primosomal protein N' (replication factor Y)